MGRPFDKHIDDQELKAVVPSCADLGQGAVLALSGPIREAERHVASCAECRTKVAQYRQLVDRSDVDVSSVGSPQPDCPTNVEWGEVAAGLWPELKTQQLIAHAARCGYCGPLLRAACAQDPTPQEEKFLAQLKRPSRPVVHATRETAPSRGLLSVWRQLQGWKVLVPAGALLVIVAVLSASRSLSSPLSGAALAQFATSTHEQHSHGSLNLDVRTDSQPELNAWLHRKSQFSLALPMSSEAPGEELPFRIEGARLVQIQNKAAAYIAYQMEANPVSLIVAPISVAVASGGIEVAFKKVTFHYHTIRGYKVVTWSVHGLTYALVSQEGNRTQRSCMVCHSAMRDRDLSHTPSPLSD